MSIILCRCEQAPRTKQSQLTTSSVAHHIIKDSPSSQQPQSKQPPRELCPWQKADEARRGRRPAPIIPSRSGVGTRDSRDSVTPRALKVSAYSEKMNRTSSHMTHQDFQPSPSPLPVIKPPVLSLSLCKVYVSFDAIIYPP